MKESLLGEIEQLKKEKSESSEALKQAQEALKQAHLEFQNHLNTRDANLVSARAAGWRRFSTSLKRTLTDQGDIKPTVMFKQEHLEICHEVLLRSNPDNKYLELFLGHVAQEGIEKKEYAWEQYPDRAVNAKVNERAKKRSVVSV